MLVPIHHLSELGSTAFDLTKLANKNAGELHELVPILPCFFVPPLENKPQNPIMDNLKLEETNLRILKAPKRKVLDKKEKVILHKATNALGESREGVETLWREAAGTRAGITNSLLSWDGLRPTHPSKASPTTFLSERNEFVYSSARQHVQPRLHNSTHHITTVTQRELFATLKSTVLGVSSQLYTWDALLERFVQVGTEKRAISVGILIVDGKDDIVTASFVRRLTTIGTLLRRLELLVASLRARSTKEGPIIYSLAHSLSTTLDFVREKLVECPPANSQMASVLGILEIWNCYAPYQELLVALGDLYGRSETLDPHEYLQLYSSRPSSFLSRIYEHLTLHFERQSSHLLRAVMAFIFSNTSFEYVQYVAQSIGFGGSSQPKPTYKPCWRERHVVSDPGDADDEEEEDIFDLMQNNIETDLPSFFPQKLLHLLPIAQKSLVLLRVAQPDHALFLGSESRVSNLNAEVRWLWREEEVNAAWNGLPLPPPMILKGDTAVQPQQPASGIAYNNPELAAAFRIFDFEPGTGVAEGGIVASNKSSNTPEQKTSFQSSSFQIRFFISSFPASLPLITPTLPSLISLTFQPLTNHASTLSQTLLDIFTTRPGKLNFRTHLILLRNFLLVANPEFKARLVNALFDDAGEFGDEGGVGSARSLSIRALRRRRREKYNIDTRSMRKDKGTDKDENGNNKMPWAVGLAPHLLERHTWPPVGADLSFFLRTVIVDSLDCGEREGHNRNGVAEGLSHEAGDRDEKTTTEEGSSDEIIFEEAEWRLGFAIRDLHVGTGEKWLDPLSIESLDFLYMDYKPPRPLEILISQDILSKYQRMFTFILRLLRVENALKSLFRMFIHRGRGTVIFPTLTRSRQLVLHFRFVAQAFMSSLSGYVFDTVIGGNFDPFLELLLSTLSPSIHQNNISTNSNEITASFSDVFDLAQHHSLVLDEILSACLLRSGQKGVGDLLRQTMETVLEFTIVVGELHRGRIEEYQAAPMIEELGRRFNVKMRMLVKVLKGLVEKGPSSSNSPKIAAALQGHVVAIQGGGPSKRRSTGGLEALYHLLLRLDLTDWWSSGKGDRRKSGEDRGG